MNLDLEHVAIGGLGFGFKRNDKGFLIPLERTEHKHEVVIGDNVEMGSFVCIDRGSWRDTVIGDGTKIDNLVHIGHNAHIGRHCLIVAGTVVGGSCDISDYCFIGENVSIKQHVKIADHVTIGMGSVVLHDITEPNTTWAGNPAKKIADVQKY